MMKKRLLSLVAAACLVCALGAAPAGAAAQEQEALEVVQALGILGGDEQGDLNLDAPVTRAEFVTMMTAASSSRDSVKEGAAALFSDVGSGHWAAGYVALAVEKSWMAGYVDGTFRPDGQITLEEACAALLRLLGYEPASLTGAYPTAQLTKAAALGLRDGVDKGQGERLTRADCVTLFYNLMLAQTGAGGVYAATLGYQVTNGTLDYAALVSAGTEGPFLCGEEGLSLPFPAESAVVYRNGALSSLEQVQSWDVYYYHTGLRTLWVYSSRVSGTLTAVSPNTAAPTALTVAGVSYPIESSQAAYACSARGTFAVGDVVTLLLGMDGGVAGIVAADDLESSCLGVVRASQEGLVSQGSGTQVLVETTLACTDGSERTFYTQSGSYSAGDVVQVTVDGEGASIQRLSAKRLTGSVSSDGSALGEYDFAGDVEILDTDGEGGYARIYPQRLAGADLSGEDVAYYTLNAAGEIDRLILRDVTGDAGEYVYITDRSTLSGSNSVSASYTYYQNGQRFTLQNSALYSAGEGGAALIYQDGAVKSIRQLSSVAVDQLTQLSVQGDGRTYLLADGAQVLIEQGGSCYAAQVDDLDLEEYTVRAWYDNQGYSAGGRIRILVASPR